MLAPGSRVGPYEVLAAIGAGGMGEVYRAKDTRLGREVALKVLPERMSTDEEARRRFEREARAVAALSHPGILAIHDFGTDGDVAYAASELLEGETLRARIARGPLPQRKAVEVGAAVADGLAAAHTKGIIHRDLKPENLFLTADGRAKILDFGLARTEILAAPDDATGSVSLGTPGTEPGTILGTVGYMSPEQVRGAPADARSDIFSLGCVLYEMATGTRAFARGTAAETMAAILNEDPPEPTASGKPVPPDLSRVIAHCLEKNREERFQSAGDVAFALRGTGDGSRSLPVVAKPRAPGAAWIVTGVALLAGVAGLFGLWAGSRAGRSPAPDPPSFQQLTFRRGMVWSARFAPDGQTILYGAAWEGGPSEIFSMRADSPESRSLGLPAGDVLSLSSSGEMAISIGRRYTSGWESSGTLARLPLAGGAPREVLERVQEADWAPDGTRLAVVRDIEGRRRLEFPIGKVLYETVGWISHARVSPRGDLVAFLDHPQRGLTRGSVVVVDLAGERKTLSSGWAAGAGLAWSASGDAVWFTATKTGAWDEVRAVTLAGVERVVLRVPGAIRLQDISREGRVLLTRQSYRRETLGAMAGERERTLGWLDWSNPRDLSDDGAVALFNEFGAGARGPGAIYLRRTNGSPAVRLGEGQGAGLSPDGKWLVAIGQPGPGGPLTLLPTGAGEPRVLPSGNLTVDWAGWFPDGRRILVAGYEPGRGQRLYALDLPEAKPRAITPEGFGVSFSGRPISPDGEAVAARGPDGRIYLCPVEGGEARRVPGLSSEDSVINWRADGRALYVHRSFDQRATIDVVDVSSGRRALWKEVGPGDVTGVLGVGPELVSRQGNYYVYSYRRLLDDLFLAEGLK